MARCDLNVGHGMKDWLWNGNPHFGQHGRCILTSYQRRFVGWMLKVCGVKDRFHVESLIDVVGWDSVGHQWLGVDGHGEVLVVV